MKTIFLLLSYLTLSFVSHAGIPEDSLDSTETKKVEAYSELTLATRNIWRGISFGQSPSFQGLLNFNYGRVNVGAFGVVTTNGSKEGYGNTLELYASFDVAPNLVFTVDDYYFFNSHDSLDAYFEYSSNTQHFFEAQLNYLWKESVGLMFGYNFYSGSYDNTSGLYIESTFFLSDNVSAFIGFITGPSYLNFMEKRGITNIGISADKEIKLSKDYSATLTTSLILSPNHQNIAAVPGVGTSPIYFVAALTF